MNILIIIILIVIITNMGAKILDLQDNIESCEKEKKENQWLIGSLQKKITVIRNLSDKNVYNYEKIDLLLSKKQDEVIELLENEKKYKKEIQFLKNEITKLKSDLILKSAKNEKNKIKNIDEIEKKVIKNMGLDPKVKKSGKKKEVK